MAVACYHNVAENIRMHFRDVFVSFSSLSVVYSTYSFGGFFQRVTLMKPAVHYLLSESAGIALCCLILLY
jgi:hypothetical protein